MTLPEVKVAGVIMLSAELAELSKEIRRLTYAIDKMIAWQRQREEQRRWWMRWT